MTITGISIVLLEDGPIRAFANITFDDALLVRGLKVMERNGQMMVKMPSRRRPDGRFINIVHAVTDDLLGQIRTEVLTAYDYATRQGNERWSQRQ